MCTKGNLLKCHKIAMLPPTIAVPACAKASAKASGGQVNCNDIPPFIAGAKALKQSPKGKSQTMPNDKAQMLNNIK